MIKMPEARDCRLFPLPDVVLFPHALLPLHIFEPRYRQMTADALASDRLVTMVQIRDDVDGAPASEPVPIVDVGCLGKIVQHELLPDGRYNLILLGLTRVRLGREKPSSKLYRIAEAEILDDEESDYPRDLERGELVDLFRSLLEPRHRLDESIAKLLDSNVPLGVLCDIIAHALQLPPQLKQVLLSETHVDRRIETLRLILHEITDDRPPKHAYQPPFSLN
jgi:Lon protease-like protein